MMTIFTKVNKNNYKLYKEASCTREVDAILKDLRDRAKSKGFRYTYVDCDECGTFFYFTKTIFCTVEVRICYFDDELKNLKAKNKLN